MYGKYNIIARLAVLCVPRALRVSVLKKPAKPRSPYY